MQNQQLSGRKNDDKADLIRSHWHMIPATLLPVIPTIKCNICSESSDFYSDLLSDMYSGVYSDVLSAISLTSAIFDF